VRQAKVWEQRAQMSHANHSWLQADGELAQVRVPGTSPHVCVGGFEKVTDVCQVLLCRSRLLGISWQRALAASRLPALSMGIFLFDWMLQPVIAEVSLAWQHSHCVLQSHSFHTFHTSPVCCHVCCCRASQSCRTSRNIRRQLTGCAGSLRQGVPLKPNHPAFNIVLLSTIVQRPAQHTVCQQPVASGHLK
jgi:hypothetical protein